MEPWHLSGKKLLSFYYHERSALALVLIVGAESAQGAIRTHKGLKICALFVFYQMIASIWRSKDKVPCLHFHQSLCLYLH